MRKNTDTELWVTKMSIQPFDSTKYYPSYANPNPQLTPGQFHQIQNSWQMVKGGQFDAFKQQELIFIS